MLNYQRVSQPNLLPAEIGAWFLLEWDTLIGAVIVNLLNILLTWQGWRETSWEDMGTNDPLSESFDLESLPSLEMVPQIVLLPLRWSSKSTGVQRPKSKSFKCPCAVSTKLSGFRSPDNSDMSPHGFHIHPKTQ